MFNQDLLRSPKAPICALPPEKETIMSKYKKYDSDLPCFRADVQAA